METKWKKEGTNGKKLPLISTAISYVLPTRQTRSKMSVPGNFRYSLRRQIYLQLVLSTTDERQIISTSVPRLPLLPCRSDPNLRRKRSDIHEFHGRVVSSALRR